MKKNRVIYGLIIILSAWIMVMYNGWQTEVLFLTAIIVPLIMGILACISSRKLKVYFDEQEEYCQKDDRINKYIMLDNDSRCPFSRVELKVLIQDYSGNTQKRKIVMNSEPGTIRNFAMQMSFNHYGAIDLKIERIYAYDAFLLFRFKRKADINTTIYIFPEAGTDKTIIFEKKHFESEEEENFGGSRGQNKGEIVQVDEYREGDDIHNIHWKLSSKSDSLMVKHYNYAEDATVHIHVDMSVEKYARYSSGDNILSALGDIIASCRAEGTQYDITAYGRNGSFETDMMHILGEIETGDIPQADYFEYAMREGNGSGTNVYLTTRKERIQQLPENLKYFCFHNHKEQENKEYVLTERNLIFLENEEKPEKEETFFLNPYNDKIRPHKKLSYKNDTEGYLALMSVIALLAVYMAMFSIYDVLVIYQDFIKMSIVIAGFVFLHFILNVTGNGNEDKKKASAVKNGIIFAGYVVICFGGGFTFLFDAITEVTEIFGMEVTITEHDYGFLKYVSDDLEWLLILAAYAVTDVIYNFCQEFALSVQLIILIPLLSISLIVGYVPPVYIGILVCLYFPSVFVLRNVLSFGRSRSRKYLSDDYPYTGAIAVHSGIFTMILSGVCAVIISIAVLAGGYERPLWMDQCKSAVNKVVEAGSLEEGLRILFNMAGTGETLTSGERGSLDDTRSVYYTEKEVLEVEVRGLVSALDRSFYLKSYVGSDYSRLEWQTRGKKALEEEKEYLKNLMDILDDSQDSMDKFDLWKDIYGSKTAAFRESFPYYFALCQQRGSYYMSIDRPKVYNMSVASRLKDDTNVYKPYFSLTTTDSVKGADGYEYYDDTEEGRITYYQGYDLGEVENTGNPDNEYGKLPYRTNKADDDELLRELQEIEGEYAAYVRKHYLDVPTQFEELQKEFSDVSLIYRGSNVTLSTGDGQYKTIGYEPYIQYIRTYFEDHNFKYSLSATRKNTREDFINSFLERKTGYCIHFASSAVMMFRSMGIPARYAEGYFVTKDDVEEEGNNYRKYSVKDSAAHAWVEIYEEGIGWVAVEVTPGMENFTIEKQELFTELTIQETQENSDDIETVTETLDTQTSQEISTSQTTFAQETGTEGGRQISSQAEKGKFVVRVLVVLGMAAGFLLRYQFVSSRHTRKMKHGSNNERMDEMIRQFELSRCIFHVKISECEKNEKKEEQLLAAVPQDNIDLKMIARALDIIDKYRYAPSGELTSEEVRKFLDFVQLYDTLLYNGGNFYEKFVYKYIKCLYLKSK